jgi:Icc-related predicted phosphoesterase
LLGDVHGNRNWLLRAIGVFARSGVETIIQVGDLGIWPNGDDERTFDLAERDLAKAGIAMLVAPGNHEDYDQIEALPPRPDGWLEYRPHILLAPRGLRTTLGGRSVLWLGGAGSVDRSWRLREEARENAQFRRFGSSKRSKLWWVQETLTDADVEGSIAGGPADLMVCHDAPAPVDGIARLTTRDTDQEDLDLANESTRRLTQVVDAVRPKLLVHGHHHTRVESTYGPTLIRGLGTDGYADALAVLDLEPLAVTYWDGGSAIR